MVSPSAGAAISDDADVEHRCLGENARLAELADAIRPAEDRPHRHTRIGAAGTVNGIPRQVRIGEQRVDRCGEDAHQLLEEIFTARRGRLLTGRIEASVFTSMALPSGRASWRA